MTQANPLWGAPRIHGEMGKLGIAVSERTVSRLLPRRRRPPSQTWRPFLTNHVASLVSMDCLTVPTLTGRVPFVFVLLTHHRPMALTFCDNRVFLTRLAIRHRQGYWRRLMRVRMRRIISRQSRGRIALCARQRFGEVPDGKD
jgi:hypothetical protein